CWATPITWGYTVKSWAPRRSISATFPRPSRTWRSSAPPSISTAGSRPPVTRADRRRPRSCSSPAQDGRDRLDLDEEVGVHQRLHSDPGGRRRLDPREELRDPRGDLRPGLTVE